MKRKVIIGCIVVLVSLSGCLQQEKEKADSVNSVKYSKGKETVVTGKIDHAGGSEMVLVAEEFNQTVQLSATSEFTFTFKLPEGTYFVLRNDKRSVKLFLNPGDNLYLEYNGDDIFNSIQFKGVGAEANNYLKEKYHRMLKQSLNTSHLYEVPEKEFRYLADSIYVIEKIYLEENAKLYPGLSSTFIEMEQASLLYDWGNKLMEYPRLTSQPNSIDKNSYFSFLKKLDVNNPSLLKIYEYKQFLNAYIAWYTEEQLKANSDKNLETYEVSLIRLQQANRLITNEVVKNYLLAAILKEQVKYFGYKNTELLFEIFELNCTDTELKKELLLPFQQYKKLVSNDRAPSVTFADVTGQSFTLDYFKSSYVYIDIWATWCLPCKRESSHFEELSRKFSNKNIQFVSLSVDEDIENWKEYLSTFKYAHNQFRVTNPEDFLNNYLIKTIPRFIIIDPEGKIMDSDAFRPSEPDLKWFAGLPDKRAI